MEKQKIVFKTKDAEGVEIELAVKMPSADARQKAALHRGRAYGEATAAKLMFKEQLDAHLREIDLWDDAKEEAFQSLRTFIMEGEMKLRKGGILKSEAYNISKSLRGARAQIAHLLSGRRRIEENTVEHFADVAHFEYLVAACTFYNEGRHEGKPYFTEDGEHYLFEVYSNRKDQQDGNDAARAFSDLFFGQANDTPEEEFLAKYGYVNGDGRLIDKKGRLIDGLGRLIDAEGYFINEDGERIDTDGNRVDDAGNYVVDFVEFLDDEVPSEPSETLPEVVIDDEE